jgi:hypothetical protein
MAFLDRIPEDSYGIFECILATLLFSLPPFVFLLFSANALILFFYYSIIIFMILGFASHLRSHDVADDLKSLISKAYATRKEIKKYENKGGEI